jgi:signal transduction histidine kinase
VEQEALVRAVATRLAARVEREALRAARERAEAIAERSAGWMQRLVSISSELSRAESAAAVADALMDEVLAALHPDNAALWLLDDSGSRLNMLRSRGYPPELRERFASYGLHEDNPLCHAIRHGEPLWMESWQEYEGRFPQSEEGVRAVPRPPQMAFACVPLVIEGQTVGGLAFTFLGGHRFAPDERTFISLLAQQCARGLERTRLYQRALEAVRVRDDFLSMAGHELRTPLTTLLLQAERLVQVTSTGPAEVGQRSAQVLASVDRLSRLVDELLDISRITTGRLQLQRERVDLGGIVSRIVDRACREASRPAGSVRLQAADVVEGWWDRARLEQVVTSLVANALKYGQGEPVEVQVTCDAGTARVTVRDHGIGIAPADQSRIFERFERAVSSRRFGGLGLGLWISRQIVEAHGGRISVASSPGQGATFTVTLPVDLPAR